MSDVVISARDVSKSYAISHRGPRATTLAEALAGFAKNPLRRDRRETFWALRDVSFDVRRGEVTGIVGRNGAGKSTLLKILSEITEPTRGEIDLWGRVGSLLEVGTGFHPELTGRENIFLNGAILGMRRHEIARRFDEIVEFSGVAQFLDTPVKRYSSGMYVRLAFAVAAHLEPEILIVDEVLAVGDFAFQKKCLGKIGEVAHKDGRTVLFVSHSMSAVAQLCDTALCLDAGRIVHHGAKDEVIRRYLAAQGGSAAWVLAPDPSESRRRKKVYFRKVEVVNFEGEPAGELDVRQPFRIRASYEVPSPLSRVEMSIRVLRADGRAIFTTLRSDLAPEALIEAKHGIYECLVTVPGMSLMPGDYTVSVAAHAPVGEIYDQHESVLRFTICDTGTGFARYGDYDSIGVVIMNLPWEERLMGNSSTDA